MVFVEGGNAPTVQHDNLKEAEEEAKRLADKCGKKVSILESVSVIEPEEVNVRINSFEAALKFLGRENNARMCGIPGINAKAMAAIYKLCIIAEAWNKSDNFVPDFSNHNQFKYFPWFSYDEKSVKFASVGMYYTQSNSIAYFGSRLCFKTEDRAAQFGEQFIHLWNDFLLFR